MSYAYDYSAGNLRTKPNSNSPSCKFTSDYHPVIELKMLRKFNQRRATPAIGQALGFIFLGLACAVPTPGYSQTAGGASSSAEERFCQPKPSESPDTSIVTDSQLERLREDFGGKQLLPGFADMRSPSREIIAEALRVGPLKGYFAYRVLRDLVIIDELNQETACTAASPCTQDSYVRGVVPQSSGKPVGLSLPELIVLWKSVRDTDIQRAMTCMSVARSLPDYLTVAAAEKKPDTPDANKVLPPAVASGPDARDCRQRLASIVAAHPIKFAKSSSDINSTSLTALKEVAGLLKECATLEVTLQGYTDGDGSNDYNQKLSEQRAAAALAVISAAGLAQERLHAVGYGKKNPPSRMGSLAEFKADCRRVEIALK